MYIVVLYAAMENLLALTVATLRSVAGAGLITTGVGQVERKSGGVRG